MALHLSPESLDWSLRHHIRFGDTDLFPRAFEFDVAEKSWGTLRSRLAECDLLTHEWRAGRSLLVMKDNVSFRRATQFDPIDSILFAAMIWTIGPLIEAKRPARDRNVVLSYRFEPSTSGQLFAPGKMKRAFWTHTIQACNAHENPWLVTTDITDFYSQIRHSHLQHLLGMTVSHEYVEVIMRALRAVQGNIEIGVPVGPHAAHLLAELTLVRFDEYISDKGYSHVRFADDIHVACSSEDNAREALYSIAEYMHSNLQLSLSRYAAAHVHTTQGADGRSGATLTVRDAMANADFKACLVIGIAFGFDRRTQRLGDVLVAEQIQPYEHAKVEGSDETIHPRGAPMLCGSVLSERFRNRMADWVRTRTVTRVALQQGTVLAGAKLVNSRPFRDRLYATFKSVKPIGGEMEGHGAYAAVQNSRAEVVLVKSICDWADGDKNDRAQQFAADTAVDACVHLLSKPDVLDSLRAVDIGLMAPKPTELPSVESLLQPRVVATAWDESDEPFPWDL